MKDLRVWTQWKIKAPELFHYLRSPEGAQNRRGNKNLAAKWNIHRCKNLMEWSLVVHRTSDSSPSADPSGQGSKSESARAFMGTITRVISPSSVRFWHALLGLSVFVGSRTKIVATMLAATTRSLRMPLQRNSGELWELQRISTKLESPSTDAEGIH